MRIFSFVLKTNFQHPDNTTFDLFKAAIVLLALGWEFSAQDLSGTAQKFYPLLLQELKICTCFQGLRSVLLTKSVYPLKNCILHAFSMFVYFPTSWYLTISPFLKYLSWQHSFCGANPSLPTRTWPETHQIVVSLSLKRFNHYWAKTVV